MPFFTHRSLLVVSLFAPAVACERTAQTSPPRAEGTAGSHAIARAATRFLDSLTADQRAKVLFRFPGQSKSSAATFQGGMDGRMSFVGERYGQSLWSNYPVSDVPRPGLALGNLAGNQREAALQLLQVALSKPGYQKVLNIMGSDQALADTGTHFVAGRDAYTIGVFGTPGADARWMLQFGGHHLALNLVIAGDREALAPALTGAQPAVYSSGDQTVRVLAAENDKAFALMAALNESQARQATLGYQVADLVLGPGKDRAIAPEGIKASELNETQRALLLELIAEWTGIVNDRDARERQAQVAADIGDTYFAWSGPTTHEPGKNGTAYYRIQGPRIIIEFAPQGVGGDPSMHVHTIYRDPTNEYGHALR